MKAFSLFDIDYRTISYAPRSFLNKLHPTIIRIRKSSKFSTWSSVNDFRYPQCGLKSGDRAVLSCGPPRQIQRSSYVADKKITINQTDMWWCIIVHYHISALSLYGRNSGFDIPHADFHLFTYGCYENSLLIN